MAKCVYDSLGGSETGPVVLLDECLEGRRKNESMRGPSIGSPGLTVKGRADFWGGNIVASLGQEHSTQAQGSRREIRAEQQGQMGRMHYGGEAGTSTSGTMACVG